MKKKILVIIGARGIGDLIYHLPLLRSLHLTHGRKIIILSNKVNQSKEVFKNESFFEKIIEFDNYRYGIFKTLINIIKFKKLINKLNVNFLVLTANYRRLILPVLLSGVKEKKIFGTGLFKINKDRTLDHLTISERLLKYTNELNLKKKINNFFLTSKKLKTLKIIKCKKIFISIDSHHDQNNWPIENYLILINKLIKKNNVFVNFAPNKKYFLKYFPHNLIRSKKIIFTYKKKISEIIKIINQSDVIIGNESGPVCLGASLKKKVHAIYLPIHTKPESKIIYKKNNYYNAKKLSSKIIIKKILKSI
jgi:ADP-heptose:LPS heptosyltransferase